MNDWNQNGKYDSGDKTIFHTEVAEKNNPNNTQHNQFNDEEGIVLVDWIINGVCFLILAVLIGSEIKVNAFTALLSLGCMVKIGWSLFVLFINATSR